MKRWGKLIARPQSVGLVRNSLWGASAKTNKQAFENIPEIVLIMTSLQKPPMVPNGPPYLSCVFKFPCKPVWIPGGWQDVSVLGLEDLLLEEVLLV